MKKYQKIIAVVLAVVVVALGLAACGTKKDKDKTDMDYVKEKGTLIVGITDFDPMDYKDENGNWIGFDADMANAFAKSLGVNAEFVEIKWENKILELNNKTIDVAWNGMTLTDEVLSSMNCTKPYCNNAQVIIVPADKADQYKTPEDCKDLQFAVEAGSAGEEQAKAFGFKYTPVEGQSDALTEVKAGTSQAAIIDSLMAGSMVGEGTDYADLTYILPLNEEKYGVGFRKGSDLTDALNKFFDDCRADGTMQKTAEKYGTQEALIK